MKIKLDRAKIGQVLKGDELRAHLHRVADPIASEVRLNPVVVREGADVYTEDYETDRAVVAIMLDHEVGAGLEAKYKLLRGTAAAAGLEIS